MKDSKTRGEGFVTTENFRVGDKKKEQVRVENKKGRREEGLNRYVGREVVVQAGDQKGKGEVVVVVDFVEFVWG